MSESESEEVTVASGSESEEVTAKDHRWGIWVTAGAAVLAALITGVFGLLGSDDSSTDSKPVGKPTSPSPSRSTASLDPSTPTAPLPEPEPVSATGVNLARNTYLMLTDDPIKPRRGEEWGLPFGDFSLDYNGFWVNTDGDGTLVLLDSGQKGSLEVCRSDGRYADEGTIALERLSKGARICVINNGHVGLITVRAMPNDQAASTFLKLDVKIWRNAVRPDSEG
ncbi:hypothetical protein AB0I10_38285 [Streptomyces sp. NPDC050636]|uniref:hypothetical protein n=1 Tax=Streptomyces sp. NPDC050636 TaxID=3154510 RepID=UPI00343009D1